MTELGTRLQQPVGDVLAGELLRSPSPLLFGSGISLLAYSPVSLVTVSAGTLIAILFLTIRLIGFVTSLETCTTPVIGCLKELVLLANEALEARNPNRKRSGVLWVTSTSR